MIQDLYYNLEQRRKVDLSPFWPSFGLHDLRCFEKFTSGNVLVPRMQALSSGAEEYSRILDLVGKYAVSRPDVAFSCKKQV